MNEKILKVMLERGSEDGVKHFSVAVPTLLLLAFIVGFFLGRVRC